MTQSVKGNLTMPISVIWDQRTISWFISRFTGRNDMRTSCVIFGVGELERISTVHRYSFYYHTDIYYYG